MRLIENKSKILSANSSPLRQATLSQPNQSLHINSPYDGSSLNQSLSQPQGLSVLEKLKKQKQSDDEQKAKQQKLFIESKEQYEFDHDKKNKKLLQLQQQPNEEIEIRNNQDSYRGQQEAPMELYMVDVPNLVEATKRVNLNLKDFNNLNIYQIQQIIDCFLRKLSDLILQQQSLKKGSQFINNDLSNQAELSSKMDSHKQQQRAQWALKFWDNFISLNIPQVRDYCRWDIFEDNFVVYLLDNMNIMHDLFYKIQWKLFFSYIHNQCTTTLTQNTEVPKSASCPDILPPYKGAFIMKQKFKKFAGNDGIYLALRQAVDVQYKQTLDEQFQSFSHQGTFTLAHSSLYRYADGSWYRGERFARRRQGRGKLQLKSGDNYDGEFKLGLRHGLGIMSYICETNSDAKATSATHQPYTVYRGKFENDTKEGECTVEFCDGSRFHGQFRNNLQVYGTQYWPPDNKGISSLSLKEYTGFWKGHQMQGQGIMSDKNEISTGIWKQSQLNGAGIKQDINGQIFMKGQFDDGVLNGQICTIQTTDGLYVGQLVNGKFDGQGTMTYTNKDCYDGSWKQGLYHGKGTYTENNGSVFQGSWQFGTKNGKGKYRSKNEMVEYEGEYKQNSREGYGQLKQTLSHDLYYEYVGYFSFDMFNGQGKYQAYESNQKKCLLEQYEGSYVMGKRQGFGQLLKLQQPQQADNEQDQIQGTAHIQMRDYVEQIGDFINDKYIGDGIVKIKKCQ